jgi:hypothetical protein
MVAIDRTVVRTVDALNLVSLCLSVCPSLIVFNIDWLSEPSSVPRTSRECFCV